MVNYIASVRTGNSCVHKFQGNHWLALNHANGITTSSEDSKEDNQFFLSSLWNFLVIHLCGWKETQTRCLCSGIRQVDSVQSNVRIHVERCPPPSLPKNQRLAGTRCQSRYPHLSWLVAWYFTSASCNKATNRTWYSGFVCSARVRGWPLISHPDGIATVMNEAQQVPCKGNAVVSNGKHCKEYYLQREIPLVQL